MHFIAFWISFLNKYFNIFDGKPITYEKEVFQDIIQIQ